MVRTFASSLNAPPVAFAQTKFPAGSSFTTKTSNELPKNPAGTEESVCVPGPGSKSTVKEKEPAWYTSPAISTATARGVIVACTTNGFGPHQAL